MTDSAQNSKQILAQKGTAATPSISFLGGNATGMYSAGTNKLGFSTAGAFAAVIDASGNVGVGVVPSAWAATSYALQVGSGASMFSNNVAYSYFSTNAYFEGANWRYMGTGAAAQYVQAAGANIWYYAASGTAGNTFAWQEAMRIGSNGNVGIGTASTSSAKLQVTGSSTVSSQVNVAAVIGAGVTSDLLLGSVNGNTPFVASQGAYPLAFRTNANEAMRIDSSGNVGIGQTLLSSGFRLNIADTTARMQMTSTIGTNIAYSTWNNTGGNVLVGIESSTGGSIFVGTGAYSAVFGHGNGYPVAFATSNTERMRIDASGNVGIGTASPAAKLDVAGTIYSRPGNATGAIAILTADATSGANGISLSASFATGGYGPIVFNTTGTESMRIDASGNVGIGGTSTGSKLWVGGAVTLAATSGGEGGQIDFNNTGNTTTGMVIDVAGADVGRIFGGNNNFTLQMGQFGGTGGTVQFYTESAERMRIASGSDTTITGANGYNNYLKLQANVTSANGGNYLSGFNTNSYFGNDAGFGLGSGVDGGHTSSSYFTIYKANYYGGYVSSLMTYNYTNNYWDFYTAGTLAMRLNSNGDLNIGAAGGGVGKLNSYGGYGPAGFFENNGTTEIINISNSSNTAFTAMRFIVNAFSTVVGSISCSTSATAFNTSSDYRLKNSVTPMTSGLAAVSALKPVTYKWNADNSNGEGFIAHELAEVIPLAVFGEKDAVDKDGKIQPQGVDYSKVVVHLVAAIQELAAKVAALEGK